VGKEQRAFVLGLQRERGEIIPWVSVNPDTADRIRYFLRPWVHACKQVGLMGRIFYDFRRTAVRNMVRASVPEVPAMSISGHRTRSVFDRYNIVSEEDLREAAHHVSTLPIKDRDKKGTMAPIPAQTVTRRTR